jgi:ribosomal protein S18 acetylase RimI-like enzyme
MTVEAARSQAIQPMLIDARATDYPTLSTYARQLIYITRESQEYYQAMGAQYAQENMLDPDSTDDQSRWLERLARSGRLDETGVAIIGAFRIDRYGKPDRHDNAMVGSLILNKLGAEDTRSLCEGVAHTPTIMGNFFVQAGLRGSGLGRQLLATAAALIHPEDTIAIGVDSVNHRTIAMYERYGFTGDPQAISKSDLTGLESYPMQIQAAQLQETLGVSAPSFR